MLPQKKADRAEQKERDAEAAAAEITARYNDAVEQCHRCRKCFMGSCWLARHSLSFCVDRAALLSAKRRERQVKLLLKERGALFVAERKEQLRNLRRVRVSLRGNADPRFGGGKIGLHVDKRTFVVTSIVARSLDYFSGRIEFGFVLILCNRVAANYESINAPQLQLLPSGRLGLEFLRPPAPLPLRGLARKGTHKPVRYAMHQEQLQWLKK